MADRVGGKLVMAWGIAVFSLTSLLMPLALSKAVRSQRCNTLIQLCFYACFGRDARPDVKIETDPSNASVASQVAAAALTFPAVLATRVCIGLGEGVALPAMNNMVAGLQREKRSTALGIAFTGFHCGTGNAQHLRYALLPLGSLYNVH